LLSSIRVIGKPRKKAFSALEILILIVSIWLTFSPRSASGANQSWTDTINLYKYATSVYPDIRTFTNNEKVAINVTVAITSNSSIGILQYYKLSANNTDFVIISEGTVSLSTNTYYGLQPGQKLVFTVEAKPKDSAVEGATATVQVSISYTLPAMHVERIDFKQTATSKLDITVTIYDDAGKPVTRATVYMDIKYPDGSVRSVSAVTSVKGVATYTISKPAKGTYTVTVTNVIHNTLTYDPSANKETTDSYTVK